MAAVQSAPQQKPASSSTNSAKEKINFHTVEEYRRALQAFSPPKADDAPLTTTEAGLTLSADPLVDEFFMFIAQNGRPHLSWELIRPAFIWKLQTVMNDMHVLEAERQTQDDHQKEALINDVAIGEAKKFMLDKAAAFDGTPFTIQRLCELLTSPLTHYHSTGVFLRALEKNINVVSTITEEGLRITGVDEVNIGMEGEGDGPIPVERNFIVSVDEVDEPLPKKMAKLQQNGNGIKGGRDEAKGPNKEAAVDDEQEQQSAEVGTTSGTGEEEEKRGDVEMKEAANQE